eukprot:jgi/Botrbrau1/12115/Bobra.0186s0033.1
MSAPVFAVFFVGSSYPITQANFQQVDPTHWVLDVLATVSPAYRQLEEISLFLLQPGLLEAGLAMALYVSVGGAEWQYRGYVSSSHPSEVMPLQWPEPTPSSAPTVQLGVSLEPEAEARQKEGSKLAGRQEFAKRVAMDLYRYMESFNEGSLGDRLLLPTNVLERWFTRFDEKFKRDPDYLMRHGEKVV